MKELSIEEKAKAYDEAIEKAEKIHNEHKAQPFDVMLKVFPELKENKIKDIRKQLIKAFGSIGKKEWGGVNVKDAIAWLEKQGEKGTNGNDEEIPNSNWSEEDEKIYNRIYDLIHAAYANYDVDEDGKELGEYAKITSWFQSLKERVVDFDNGYKVGFSAAKHNQLKPTDEQIYYLSHVVTDAKCKNDIFTNGYKPYPYLSTLLQQLKKLKK